MNASRLRGIRSASCMVAAMALLFVPNGYSRADDFGEAVRASLAYPIDPMHTRPTLLDKGAILPGEIAPWECRSGTDITAPLALSDAVDLALCNNPQIKSAWAAIKIQAAAVGVADAAYLPTISATGSRLRTGTSYSDAGLPSSTAIGNTVYGNLSWRLFDFGGRAASRQSANSLLSAAMADHEAGVQRTLARTIQAYFDAQSSRAAWQAKEQGEAIASATLESARRREASGVVAHSDTLQAATALAKATLEKNRALGDYRKNVSVLIYAMGLPAASKIIFPDETNLTNMDSGIEKTLTEGTRDLDAWLQDVQRSHPAILSARAQLQAAQSNILSARAAGLPTLDFSANYYQNGYPGQGIQSINSHITTVGISVTIPIFDGFASTYRVRSAEAQAEQRHAELMDIEDNVLMEVVKAYADADSSMQNLQASQSLLEAAEEALAASRRKYDKGAADILEMLNTQAALADARQERIRCLSEWQSARLRLLAQAGLLGRAPTH